MVLDLAMPDPAQTTAVALKQIFESRGIPVTGTARVHHAPPPEIYPDAPIVLGPAPVPPSPTAIVFAEHLSPPLSEIVRVTDKAARIFTPNCSCAPSPKKERLRRSRHAPLGRAGFSEKYRRRRWRRGFL